jgi:hypothetical protein
MRLTSSSKFRAIKGDEEKDGVTSSAQPLNSATFDDDNGDGGGSAVCARIRRRPGLCFR